MKNPNNVEWGEQLVSIPVRLLEGLLELAKADDPWNDFRDHPNQIIKEARLIIKTLKQPGGYRSDE